MKRNFRLRALLILGTSFKQNSPHEWIYGCEAKGYQINHVVGLLSCVKLEAQLSPLQLPIPEPLITAPTMLVFHDSSSRKIWAI